jgi:branched-chain amino acid transport system permease protein
MMPGLIEPDFLAAVLDLAALLALVSVGFNLVYGVLRFLNLAHAEIVVMGALLVHELTRSHGFTVAVMLGVVVWAGLGILVGRLLFRPLRLQPRGAMLATSLGLGLLLQVAYSITTKQAAISLRPAPIALGPVVLAWTNPLVVVVIVVVVVGGLEAWLRFSRLGQAVWAVAENPLVAESWGLPVGVVYDMVFALSFSLAALAGVFFAVHSSISFGFAFKILVWSFAAVLLGGLGKILGGVLASLPIAAAWAILGRLGFEPYVDAIVLLLCAGSYLVLPEGLLGRTVRPV